MAQKMIDQKMHNSASGSKPAPEASVSELSEHSAPRPAGRPSSTTGSKRKSSGTFSSHAPMKHRQCEKAGCPTKIPICFARVTERCCGSGWTSRWYHLSPAEHFCNECFEYFYRKEGYNQFMTWKNNWNGKATVDVNVRTFMADQFLPQWLQCSFETCHKWRQLPRDGKMTTEFITRFVCGMNWQGVKKENQSQCCAVPEDERVSFTKTVPWLQQLIMSPKLRDSPALPYVSSYFYEDVGLRPIQETHQNGTDDTQFDGHVQPFLDSDTANHTNMFHPAMLNSDETMEFSCYAKQPSLSMYLGARNLVMALWAKNIHARLTYIECMRHLICRGICRIHYIELIKYLIASFSQQGIINYGLLPPMLPLDPLPAKGTRILVIGAGPSGLSAAYQLSKCGLKVTVLEARNRLGGRIHDNHSMGVCVGLGAQNLTGEINNPLTIMTQQIGGRLKPSSEGCCVMNYRGEFVSSAVDRRVEFHFNALLDIVAEWRQKKTPSCDCNLYDKVMEMHQQFLEETQLKFSEEEIQAFNFQLSNLEHHCGAPLSKVSAIFWDQNEDSAQFAGTQMLLNDGYGKIFDKMAEGLDIQYKCEVTHIEYNKDRVKVKSSCDQTWKADKVIVTVPLAVLQSGCIKFTPPLPEKKLKAINKIGIGLIEKVVLKFSYNFWSLKVKNAPCFGRTTKSPHERGLFPVFYDLSSSKGHDKCHILVTHVCGDALDIIRNQTDEEIMQSCLAVLKALFPVEDIPAPQKYFVTRWRDDSYAGMSYSYLPVGVNGTTYDTLSDEVSDTVYFAGEATISDYPQSVTGAYLSGIREANKILSVLYDTEDT